MQMAGRDNKCAIRQMMEHLKNEHACQSFCFAGGPRNSSENDNIAAGLIDEAQKNGYLIPRDFAVTGFDNLDKAICFNPQITMVAHKRETLANR